MNLPVWCLRQIYLWVFVHCSPEQMFWVKAPTPRFLSREGQVTYCWENCLTPKTEALSWDPCLERFMEISSWERSWKMGGHEHGAVEGALKGPRGTLACTQSQFFWGPKPTSFSVSSPGEQSIQGQRSWVLKELEILGVWQCWEGRPHAGWGGSWCWAPGGEGVSGREKVPGGRAPGTSITSSLVLLRVPPEAKLMIRLHHQCEDLE